MDILRRLAACATLLAAFAVPTASIQAQATPIATGHGSFISPSQLEHRFEFSLVALPDGSVQGHAIGFEPATQAFVFIDLDSFMFIGDTLAVAGTITVAINMPPQYPVGGTAFFAVKDNAGASDTYAGLGSVPPPFGNMSIQQIVGLIGPPPPQAFTPLLRGDIRIF